MLSAAVLTENGTEVIVGLVAAVALVAAAWVPVRRTRRAAEQARDTLGEKPADDVTVVSMMQALVAQQSDLVGRVAGHDGTLAEHAEKLQEHDRLHDEHIARLEQHAEILRQLRGETH